MIGNPPYVRQEQITPNKDFFKAVFAVYRSTADLYVYFYEIAHRLLRSGGTFGMITSNKFMRAAYGEPLRKYLAENAHIEELIDFGDLPVFPDASAYPCVVLTVKAARDGRTTRYLRVPSLEFESLKQLVEEKAGELPKDALAGASWRLMSPAERAILAKMERASVPLKAWLGQTEIRRGVLTGFNEAFFIDEATRARLIAEDPKSAELIKPLVVGDDIKHYEIEFKGRYLIRTYIGVPIEKYPAIFKHLKRFQPQLERRWDKGEHWWELRHCDYYEDFEKPKIMYPVIAKKNTFAIDKAGFFSNDKTFIIPQGDYFCLALLNSSLGFLWARNVLSGLRGDYLEYRSQSMNKFPIRRIAFTTPEEERARLVEEGKKLYQDFLETKDPAPILDLVERCLPKDAEGNFIQEKEKSDVVHDLLAFLAEQMIEMHKQKREIIERFWTDLEGVTDAETFKKLRRGKQERTLVRSEACRPFVDPESGSTRTLEASLGWNEAAFREFTRALAGRISNLSDLVEVYQRYAPDFKELMEKIETTDRLIDQIVYRLYGLTDEEIALVEGQGEAEGRVEQES